jgi:hypothetical protein
MRHRSKDAGPILMPWRDHTLARGDRRLGPPDGEGNCARPGREPRDLASQPTLAGSRLALLALSSAAARAASQSRLNWTMPLSVSG